MHSMRYLLDTDMMIFMIRALRKPKANASAKRKANRVIQRIKHETAKGVVVGVSAITVSELEYGVANAECSERERRAVYKVLAPFEWYEYESENAPKHYGRVRRELEDKGTPIGAMDLLIAAHALSLGAVLVTNNTSEFGRISGLHCENWTVNDTDGE